MRKSLEVLFKQVPAFNKRWILVTDIKRKHTYIFMFAFCIYIYTSIYRNRLLNICLYMQFTLNNSNLHLPSLINIYWPCFKFDSKPTSCIIVSRERKHFQKTSHGIYKRKDSNFINSSIMKLILFCWYNNWLAFQNQINIKISKLFPEMVRDDKDLQSN